MSPRFIRFVVRGCPARRRRAPFPGRRWLASLGVSILVGYGTGPASAGQDNEAVPAGAEEQQTARGADATLEELLDPTWLEQRIAALAAQEADEAGALGRLREILANVRLIASTREQLDSLQRFDLDERLESIQREADQLQNRTPAPPAPEVPPDADFATLNELLEAAQGELESARVKVEAEEKQLQTIASSSAELQQRPAALAAELAEAQRLLDETAEQLAEMPPPSEATPEQLLRHAALEASRRLQSLRTGTLQRETELLPARSRLLEARRALVEGRLKRAEEDRELLQQRVESLVDVVDEAERRAIQVEVRSRLSDHPLVEQIDRQTLDFGAMLQELRARKSRQSQTLARIEALSERWQKDLNRDVDQVKRTGLTEVLGLQLRNQRSRLPNTDEFHEITRQVRREMRQLQSRLFELDAMNFDDPAEEVHRRIQDVEKSIPPDELPQVTESAREALESQASVLDSLQLAYQEYAEGPNSVLSRVHHGTASLIEIIEGYEEFIDARILWIQSATPVSGRDLIRTVDAVLWVTSPKNWLATGVAWWNGFRTNPMPLLLGLAVTVLLFLVRRRARARLRDLAPLVKRASTDRFAYTLEAGAFTLLIPAAWPALLAVIGWHLSLSTAATDFPGAVAAALLRVALLLYSAMVVWWLCQEQGLADAHFKWDRSKLALTRRHLRWLVPLVLPLAFIIALTTEGDFPLHESSLGRLSFMVAMLLAAIFIGRLFRPDQGVLSGILAHRRGGWLDRLRFIWFPLLVLAPLALIVVAAMGYFYTALQLERHLLESALLILGVVVVHQLLLRWLIAAQRRLALEQARKKAVAKAKATAAQAAAARAEKAVEEGAAIPAAAATEVVQVEEVEVDIASVGAQSQRLLRTTSALALVIGLLVVWANVLPALGMLRDVEVWPAERAAAAAPEEAAGGAEDAPPVVPDTMTTLLLPVDEDRGGITLADIGLAIVILVLMVIISKDIPGLLEIAILQRLPITPGGRYAIVTVVRYVIVILGLVLAFDAIGIGWSKVQWLAAAITLGLGFGLQEIFANFVSGLIILFERPIRLGDTVTVGDISGTVSRIRMRATTITDWDRKELIIPNKEFITGNVVNWSLSDPTLRIRIPVGIAYGSDTQKAVEILLRIAREHELVLDDPKSQALFLGFGESSLDFELRVFVPSIEHFLPLRHDLHMKIDRAFRDAGIEIAFPQRDIHVRSISAGLPVELSRGGAGSDDPAPRE